MLCRIEKYKGHGDLIKGFSKIPKGIKDKYKIFFVGSGSDIEKKHLKEKFSSIKLNKYFEVVDYIKKDSLVILNNFDLFFSLTRDFEGFGYSIAESLYVGTPVVSTKVGGVTEFLSNNNSNLIKPKDIKGISELLLSFYKNRKKFKKKSIIGKKLIIKEFNSNVMAKKYFNYFVKDFKLNHYEKIQ